MFRMIFLLLLFVLTSCAKMEDYKVVQTPDGMNRIFPKNMSKWAYFAARAIRDDEGKVVVDEKQAKKIFDSIKEPSDIDKVAKPAESCGINGGYLASLKVHAALAEVIKESHQPEKVKSLLEKANEECKEIKRVSLYHYILAYSAQKQENDKERNKQLKRFLAYSEAAYPAEFFQYEPMKMGMGEIETATFRLAAEETLENKKPLPLSKNHQGARMRFNSIYGPGGQNVYDPLWIALFNANRFESFYGLIYDYPTKYFSIMPEISYGTESGMYLNLKLRKQLYESYDRKFQVGISAGANQWKRITYTGRGFGNYLYETDATVDENGYNYFGSVGATYRPFLPSFGIATDARVVRLTNLDSTRVFATALGFYEFQQDMGIRAGLLNNEMIAEWYVASIFIGYNFDTEYLISGFGRTF